MIDIRPEKPGDEQIIHAIHEAAFETGLEARLTDRLRTDGDIVQSLMAIDGDIAAGNLILSHMSAEADGQPIKAAALGPIGVLPELQGDGIGDALIRAAVDCAKKQGFAAMFLLGSPDYYGRFGFSAATAAPFASPYAGPYWQALVLDDAFILPSAGRADYAPAFAAFEGE